MPSIIRRLATAVFLLPLFGVILAFAVANRHLVTVSADPFTPEQPVLRVSLPLFLVILLAVILGVLVGGIATWAGQAKWREAARRYRAELQALRASHGGLVRPSVSPGPH